jgi:hypothetical protein
LDGTTKGLIALLGSEGSLPVLEGVKCHRLGSLPANGGVPRPVCFPKAAGPFRSSVSVLRSRLTQSQSTVGMVENTAFVWKAGDAWQVMGTQGVRMWSRDAGTSFRFGELFQIEGEGGR